MKLLLAVLILVVLPTALLSLLAGRSIQARELLLDRRLELEAQETLEGIGREMADAVAETLSMLDTGIREWVEHGSDMAQLPMAMVPLRQAGLFVDDVFLFMNPWGFVYPDAAAPESSTLDNRLILLGQSLAFRLSRGRRNLSFVSGDQVYVFGPVAAEPGLYVGYQVDMEGFEKVLWGRLRSYSTPHIEYRLLRTGPLEVALDRPPYMDLEVSDNLTVLSERMPLDRSFRRDPRRPRVLVAGYLLEPFDHLEIGAVAINAKDLFAARALQARLVRWSVLLLAFVILASTLLLIVIARKQAAQARLRSIFLAGLSHDIRTPVTAMLALAENLQQGRVVSEARRQQSLDSIVMECERLQTLIERVLLFFRHEQGGGCYQMRPIELLPLMERAISTFCSRYRGRVNLTFDVAASVDPIMWGDAAALEQALHNLLENAWKYGKPQPQQPDVVVPVVLRLSIERGGIWRRCLSIAVEDSGPGVPVQEGRHIFKRFYRGVTPHIQQAGGIGLGLALVSEIVREHGGRVLVERSPLGGARFVLLFRPFPLTHRSWLYLLRGLHR